MSTDRDRLAELVGLALVCGLAAVLLLGLGMAVPAEVGARLSHGRWLPLGWTVLWRVGWGWLTHVDAGPLAGWPDFDHRWLPSAPLYAELLVAEVVALVALSVIGAVVGVRLWNATHQPATSSRARLPRTGNSMPRSHRRGA
jgi:hypothetical protein